MKFKQLTIIPLLRSEDKPGFPLASTSLYIFNFRYKFHQ